MTIKDIAKLSGYGVSTVSRALNGHSDISKETREKIQKIVAENNYIPNQNARNLKCSAGKSIVLMVKGSMNMFFSAIIENIQAYADKTGAIIVLHYLNEQDNEVRTAVKICREQKPMGIIFLGGNLEHFKNEFSQIQVPCVLSTTNASELDFPNLSSVCIDDIDAGKRAIDHLFEQGHTEIGVITGDVETPNPSKLRFLGVKQGFEKNNSELKYTQKSSYTFNDAYEATKAIMERNPDISAIFAMSDIMAIGAVRALADMGKAVPRDVSVLGFDGIMMTEFTCPRITTMEQPSQQIAELTIKLLAEMIDNNAASRHIQVEAKYKAGESVSC